MLRRAVGVLVLGTALLAQRHDDYTFRHQAIVSASEAVYVLGDLPELGAGDLTRSVRMAQPTPGNWSVVVRLPVNRAFSYSFYRRSNGPANVGNPGHGTLLAGPLNASTATRAILPAKKRMICHAALAGAQLSWRQGGGAYQSLALLDRGPGRTAGERLWEAPAFGAALRPVEFYLTDASSTQRLPSVGTYTSPLDAFFLQDGHVFTYFPAASVTPHRRDYVPSNPPVLQSAILGESRAYRVMLPRGYDVHSTRRYPVIYAHDGPWMWDLNSPYLFTDAIDPNGDTLAGLVKRGEMGECIVVGIDWGTQDPRTIEIRRARDYLPPGDGYDYGYGYIAGAGDKHARFLTLELKPLIDARYRTRPGVESTFVAGFSFGGVAAAFLGWDHGHVVSRIGCFSPSFWIANFAQRLRTEPLRPRLKAYVDSGQDNYSWTAEVRDSWVARAEPYVLEAQLRYVFRLAGTHTPTSLNQRLPEFGSFLYPASDEPNVFLLGTVPYGNASGANPIDLAWVPSAASNLGAVDAAARTAGPWGGVLAFSSVADRVPLAGIDILLGLDPLPVTLPLVTGPSGRMSWPLNLFQPAFAGQAGFLQVIRLDGAALSASNGLELDFGQ